MVARPDQTAMNGQDLGQQSANVSLLPALPIQVRHEDENMTFSARPPLNDIHRLNIDGDGNHEGQTTQLSDVEFLQTLPNNVNSMLLENFWTYYNGELQSIHRPTFEFGLRTHNPKSYSTFLHLCMLAIGIRYSEDTSKERSSFFSAFSKESMFHIRARQAVNTAIEEECNVHLLQGLLLFGDLEFGAGRYNNGWMHASKSSLL
jgi:Fungal specific transcription factor domain